jgi:DNA-binding NtrC family response regulator
MSASLHPPRPIVLVDDEPHILLSFSTTLRTTGFNHIASVEDSRSVLPLLEKENASVVVLDLTMPHLSGNELLAQINGAFPHVPVIVVTATDDLDTAVACMKAGAFDYLAKPVEMNRFISSVKKALELGDLREEVSSLKRRLLDERLDELPAFSSIITKNKKMRLLFQYIEAIAGSQQPVMVTGETGAGKELIARAIHDLSGRPGRLVAVNIAGLDDIMFSDTLFGHTRGAFTGADREREGLIIQAENGTLFLDEIGDLSESSQVKLLRLLQDHTFFPVGSDNVRYGKARIIVATNKDLQARVRKGAFRKDLYYRLCAHQIQVPPLRDRAEDIPLLIDHFMSEAAKSFQKKVPSYPPELIPFLAAYQFPGNVRELQALVFDAVARHRRGILSLSSFKLAIGNARISEPPLITPVREEKIGGLHCAFDRFPTLKEAEEYLIAEALKRSQGNQGTAASLLGITRQALNKRLTRKNSKATSSDTEY